MARGAGTERGESLIRESSEVARLVGEGCLPRRKQGRGLLVSLRIIWSVGELFGTFLFLG